MIEERLDDREIIRRAYERINFIASEYNVESGMFIPVTEALELVWLRTLEDKYSKN